ncbi:hypothetical protein SS05631_c18920 [Sinorhizobium sp. CCBAU 05631]|nr:hypothetical protein SS05631_c18920 [Sinorhizobium sp. CCBAU 05631]
MIILSVGRHPVCSCARMPNSAGRSCPPVAAIFVRFSCKNQQESGVAHRETRDVPFLRSLRLRRRKIEPFMNG